MSDRIVQLRSAEMTPAEWASAVAVVLAAGLLRHLYCEYFPLPPGDPEPQAT